LNSVEILTYSNLSFSYFGINYSLYKQSSFGRPLLLD